MLNQLLKMTLTITDASSQTSASFISDFVQVVCSSSVANTTGVVPIHCNAIICHSQISRSGGSSYSLRKPQCSKMLSTFVIPCLCLRLSHDFLKYNTQRRNKSNEMTSVWEVELFHVLCVLERCLRKDNNSSCRHFTDANINNEQESPAIAD